MHRRELFESIIVFILFQRTTISGRRYGPMDTWACVMCFISDCHNLEKLETYENVFDFDKTRMRRLYMHSPNVATNYS